MKTVEQQFAEWFNAEFPYCYGSGEAHIVPVLKKFFSLVPQSGSYDYRLIESEIGGFQCWAMINALVSADCVEYGSSPRFAWLTDKGKRLQDFMSALNDETLITLSGMDEECSCTRQYCNCGGDQNHGCKVNVFFNDSPTPPTQ